MYEKLDRIITVDGQLGTVRFIGQLPSNVWGPNVTALGIEWDQSERGKNNGTLEGISYFETEVDGAGSFLKINNKKIVKERYNFIEALLRQYSSTSVDSKSTIIFGTKIAESYGFEKLNQIQSDFNNLVSVSLEKKSIYTSFDKSDGVNRIFDNLNNVTSLDLSYNLFNDLNDVWDIIDPLENLTELNLNGNRFFNDEKHTPTKHHNKLHTINLASTNITIRQVIHQILPKFPNLQNITLAGNRYTDEVFHDVSINHDSLLNIDLSYNRLQTVPHLRNKLNILSYFNLANNCISDICEDMVFNSIHCVDLRNNRINAWNIIDKMYLAFPDLKELRINGNPVFSSISIEEMTINLIARFEFLGAKTTKNGSKVNKLNGAFILDDEITNAELYFISKVRNGDYNYDRKSKRWQLLMEKYQIEDIPQSREERNNISRKKIKLNINTEFGRQITERVFLTDNSILRLKGVISRNLNRSILQFKVFYYINEAEDAVDKIKEYLDDNIATIGNFGFLDNQKLYVTLNT